MEANLFHLFGTFCSWWEHLLLARRDVTSGGGDPRHGIGVHLSLYWCRNVHHASVLKVANVNCLLGGHLELHSWGSHALFEFSLKDFHWIQRIQWIKTKSRSSMVTRDTPYLTTDIFLGVVVNKGISVTVSGMVSIHSGESHWISNQS